MPPPPLAHPAHPVVVVGADPAGLAVALELERRGVVPLILEAGDAPGWSWRRHDPWLHLHTTRRDSSLPRRPLRARPGASVYPGRDEVADYLAEVAEALAGEIRLGHRVCRLRRPCDRWRVEMGTGETLVARHVVVATGFNRVPVRPSLPGEEGFGGAVLHSSEWRRATATGEPAELAGRRVLVVGLGNTGADLVAALHDAGARVAVAVRGPVHLVPLEVLGVNWRTWYRLAPGSAFALGRLLGPSGGWVPRAAAALWGGLARRRFAAARARGLPLQSAGEIVCHWRRGRPPLTAGRFVGLVAAGKVPVLPALVGFEPGAARLAGGDRVEVDVVLLATGFRPALEELLPPSALPPSLAGADPGAWGSVDGRLGALPGLWLCGFAPELLRIRRSARRVARRIAADPAARLGGHLDDDGSTEL